jgi:hypothetical protein
METYEDHLSKDRVRKHTRPEAQEEIDEKTRRNIRYYASQPSFVIDARIAELDRERDMEQVLETNASLLALGGAVLGTTVNRKFFLLTGAVLGFLSQHAITGWCPPVPLFRALGIRTRSEIDQEKYALKALRGDFRELPQHDGRPAVERVLQSVTA